MGVPITNRRYSRLKICATSVYGVGLSPGFAGAGDLGPEACGNRDDGSNGTRIILVGGEPTKAGKIAIRVLIVLCRDVENKNAITVGGRESQGAGVRWACGVSEVNAPRHSGGSEV